MVRILVVDDEPSIRKALRMGLSSEGVEVDAVADGASGIEQVACKPYDVVIADWCLPDMNGLEVITKIRSRCPRIATILVTGHPGRNGFDQAARHEVTTCLEKPLDMKTVKVVVRRALLRRQTRSTPIRE